MGFNRRNTVARAARGVHWVAYALALVLAPVAHAEVYGADQDQTHVESESFHQNRPHNEYLCSVCRLVDVAGDAPGLAAVVPIGHIDVSVRPAAIRPLHSVPRTSSRKSRAPPIE